ncbi:MAG: FtsX-like permease family protein [Defluviitaleaceae bacterium]|nr:FtsX-like permease family protein [Defluviitaleaceae bacterium]
MWLALKSISKNPLRSILYASLLCIIFTAVNLIINSFAVGMGIASLFAMFRESLDTAEEFLYFREFLEIGSYVETAMRSLIFVIAPTVVACVFIILLIQYLFNVGRGYEIGVLRSLGLSRAGVWRQLFLEMVMLITASFMSSSIILVWHERFSFALLGVDNEMENSMRELFYESLGISGFASLNSNVMLPMAGISVIFLLITAGVGCLFASSSEPLKMIREYKKG